MKVLFETTKGNITIELNTEKAPMTSENFIEYVKQGHYNGTIFHRVIKKFMIQGGGMDANMQEKSTNTPITNEANNGLKNKKGSIAMARTSDPHSATAQFFINVVDNSFLDFTSPTPSGWGYAVFGEVIEGMKIVLDIEQTNTGKNGYHQDVPTEAIVITNASIIN
jgi:peptidyl-prolyl cis-trans isomerase B (cyclophilin B)